MNKASTENTSAEQSADAQLAVAEAAKAADDNDEDEEMLQGTASEDEEGKTAAAASAAEIKPSARKPRRKNMPRRPLSAYNLYFRDQREVIKQQVAEGNIPDDYQRDFQAAYKRLQGRQKTAEFQAAATTIAARWKALPTNERTVYEKLADRELEQYKEKKYEFNQSQKKKHPASSQQEQKQQEFKDDASSAKSQEGAATSSATASPSPQVQRALSAAAAPQAMPLTATALRPPMDARVWNAQQAQATLMMGDSGRSQATSEPAEDVSGRGSGASFSGMTGGIIMPSMGRGSGVPGFPGMTGFSQGFGGAGAFQDEQHLVQRLTELRRLQQQQDAGTAQQHQTMMEEEQLRQMLLSRRSSMETPENAMMAPLQRQALETRLGGAGGARGHTSIPVDSLLGQQQEPPSAGPAGSSYGAWMEEQRTVELDRIRRSVRQAELEFERAAARLEYERAKERAHLSLLAMEQDSWEPPVAAAAAASIPSAASFEQSRLGDDPRFASMAAASVAARQDIEAELAFTRMRRQAMDSLLGDVTTTGGVAAAAGLPPRAAEQDMALGGSRPQPPQRQSEQGGASQGQTPTSHTQRGPGQHQKQRRPW